MFFSPERHLTVRNNSNQSANRKGVAIFLEIPFHTKPISSFKQLVEGGSMSEKIIIKNINKGLPVILSSIYTTN